MTRNDNDATAQHEEDFSGSIAPFMTHAVMASPGVAIDIDFSTHIRYFPELYRARFQRPMENGKWDISFHRQIMQNILTELLKMPVIHKDNVSMVVLDETLLTTRTDPSLGELMPVVEYLWFRRAIASIAGVIPNKIHQNRSCEYINLDDRLNRFSNARVFGVRFPLYVTSMALDEINRAFLSLGPYVDAAFSAGLVPLLEIHLPHALPEDTYLRFLESVDRWLDSLENERQRVMLGFSVGETPVDLTGLSCHPNLLKVFNCDGRMGAPNVAGFQRQTCGSGMLLNHWLELMKYQTLTNDALFKYIKDCHLDRPVLHR